MVAVTDITRKAVWDTLCDLEWHMRYYGAMADRRHSAHRWMRFALLLGVAAEGGILYGGTLYPWLFYVGIVGGLALAGLTIWDALSNYARDAATCRLVSSMCGLLQREADTLWRDVESGRVSDAEVETYLTAIHSRWHIVDQWVQIEVNDALNLASAEAANEEMISRYAS